MHIPDKSKKYANHGQFLVDLINRERFARIAEVGACHGITTEKVLAGCPSVVAYYAVDPWNRYPDEWREADSLSHNDQNWWNNAYKEVVKRVKPFAQRAFLLKMPSVQAANLFEDGSLDMVYIDALHHYEPMMQDIKAWLPKLKPSGLLAGHDWWDDGTDYAQGMIGVMDALLDCFDHAIIHTGEPSPNWDHVWMVWKSDVAKSAA